MKNTIITIGIIALCLNIVLGLLLTAYPIFNMALNSIVIAVNIILIWLLRQLYLKDGFVYSLPFIFVLVALIQLVLGSLSPTHFQDNGCLIALLGLFAAEVILLLFCKAVSKQK